MLENVFCILNQWCKYCVNVNTVVTVKIENWYDGSITSQASRVSDGNVGQSVTTLDYTEISQ